MTMTELERFAFNQARFVFYTQYTIERDMILEDLSFEQAFERIQQSELGQKYLKNVSVKEMKNEAKEPGSFMDANTEFGFWINDEYGCYVENFQEI